MGLQAGTNKIKFLLRNGQVLTRRAIGPTLSNIIPFDWKQKPVAYRYITPPIATTPTLPTPGHELNQIIQPVPLTTNSPNQLNSPTQTTPNAHTPATTTLLLPRQWTGIQRHLHQHDPRNIPTPTTQLNTNVSIPPTQPIITHTTTTTHTDNTRSPSPTTTHTPTSRQNHTQQNLLPPPHAF